MPSWRGYSGGGRIEVDFIDRNTALDAYNAQEEYKRDARIEDEDRDEEATRRRRDEELERVYSEAIGQIYDRRDQPRSEPPRPEPPLPGPQEPSDIPQTRGAVSPLRRAGGGQPVDPVVTSLAASGFGRAAMDRHDYLEATERRDDHDREALERAAIEALGRGDRAAYQYYKGKSGLEVPPGIEADARQAALFARATLIAERYYRGVPAQAHQFVTRFMESGGDLQGTIGAVGTPSAEPRYTIRTILDGDRQILARINARSGTVEPITIDGKPVEQPLSRAGKLTGQSREIEYFRQNFTHRDGSPLSHQEAYELWAQSKKNPEKQRREIYEMIYRETQGTPEERHRAATDGVNRYLSETGAGRDGPVAPGGSTVGQTQSGPSVPTYNPESGRIE